MSGYGNGSWDRVLIPPCPWASPRSAPRLFPPCTGSLANWTGSGSSGPWEAGFKGMASAKGRRWRWTVRRCRASRRRTTLNSMGGDLRPPLRHRGGTAGDNGERERVGSLMVTSSESTARAGDSTRLAPPRHQLSASTQRRIVGRRFVPTCGRWWTRPRLRR